MSLIKFIYLNTCKRCLSYGYLTEAKWFEQKLDNTFRHEKFVDSKPKFEIPVTVSPKNDYRIYEKFSEIEGLDKRLALSIRNRNLDCMTPIQSHTYDILSRDKSDLLGSAETGSGKTLAFLTPYLNSIMKLYPASMMEECKYDNRGYPLILVMAPTRELAQQIQSEASKLLSLTYLNAVSVIGGESQSKQLNNIQNYGCHVLCATPGRLIDLVENKFINLRYANHMVIDEGDRMLDMGFEKDIRKIVSRLGMPAKQQMKMAMFSATFPQDVMHLVRSLMPNYTEVLAGANAGSSEPAMPKNIEHSFINCEDRSQNSSLLTSLIDKSQKTLIFCNTKKDVAFVSHRLFKTFGPIPTLTSDISQQMRTRNLFQFRTGKSPVLISTNVAARGIDISDIDVVINYGLPSTFEDYVHRSGRSGRMGKPGKCISMVTQPVAQNKSVRILVRALKKLGQSVPSFMLNQERFTNDNYNRRYSYGQ